MLYYSSDLSGFLHFCNVCRFYCMRQLLVYCLGVSQLSYCTCFFSGVCVVGSVYEIVNFQTNKSINSLRPKFLRRSGVHWRGQDAGNGAKRYTDRHSNSKFYETSTQLLLPEKPRGNNFSNISMYVCMSVCRSLCLSVIW